MTPIRSVFSFALVAVLLVGCDKSDTVPPPAPTVSSSSESVAKPASDLPPSDTAMKPVAPGPSGSSGDASGQNQATPKDLSKQQESAAMPMPGQVNDHSNVPTIRDKQ